MNNSSNSRSFGILVAYVLPGFVVLVGLTPVFPALRWWLQPVAASDLDVGPPLYAVLAATTAGMMLSCFRWVLLDTVHAWFGVRRPHWDDRRLDEVLNGLDYLVLNHYRYYDFCSNCLLAALGTYVLNRICATIPWLGLATDVGMAVLCGVLFAASRSALKNYYGRASRLMAAPVQDPLGGLTMYNGNDHGVTAAGGSDEVRATKPVKASSATEGSSKPVPPQHDPTTPQSSSAGSKPAR